VALDAVIRGAVAIADGVTKSLQATVTIAPWTGESRGGTPTYGTPIAYRALVDLRRKSSVSEAGTTIVSVATVTLLQPVAPNGASGRREPIDMRDRLVLPDGFTGPINNVKGLVDPSTTRPYFAEISLGENM
jgi:hypothetical protein